MVKDHAVVFPEVCSYKSEQSDSVFAQIHAREALLLGAVKPLELRLNSRGILKGYEASFYPVWFLCETERNVFLWRKGASLLEATDFEFWVDLPAIIEKRLDRLTGDQSPNNELNLFGPTSSAERERKYLESFLTVLDSIGSHASTLCFATSAALRDGGNIASPVLLPGASFR